MRTNRPGISSAKKLEEILMWLDGLNCAEKQDVTLSLRQPDTCKWLFHTTQYKRWRDGNGDGDGDSSFLWLRGKRETSQALLSVLADVPRDMFLAGAGKSVLAYVYVSNISAVLTPLYRSSVIHSLEESRRDGEFLAFFYCDFRNERSTRAAEAMRSILSQLLRQGCGSGVDHGGWLDDLMTAKQRGGGTRKNAKQLAGFVSHVASLVVRKPLVIVDALDECKDVPELLQALLVMQGCVRLFVTSRPLHAILSDLAGLPFVSMDDTADELSADIELHVTRELDGRQRLRDLAIEFKTEIRSVLSKKADGM